MKKFIPLIVIIIGITIAFCLKTIDYCKLENNYNKLITNYNNQCKFIEKYVQNIYNIQDYIEYTDSACKSIHIIDSLCFDYFYIKNNNFIEYNSYAFNLDDYWHNTYNNNNTY